MVSLEDAEGSGTDVLVALVGGVADRAGMRWIASHGAGGNADLWLKHALHICAYAVCACLDTGH